MTYTKSLLKNDHMSHNCLSYCVQFEKGSQAIIYARIASHHITSSPNMTWLELQSGTPPTHL